MVEYVIENGRIYTETETIDCGYIIIKSGKIAGLGVGKYEGDLQTIDAQGHHIFYLVLLIFICMVAMGKMRWMHR